MGAIAAKIAEWLLARVDFDRVGKLLKPVFWILFCCSFALAAFLTFSIWSAFGRAERLMSVAMLSKLENMPETYKALSAVLTAGLDKALQERDISPDTRNFFALLKRHQPPKDIEKQVTSGLRAQEKDSHVFMTMSSANAFVMIPADRRRLAIDRMALQHPERAYRNLSASDKSVLAYIKSLDASGVGGICNLAGKDLLAGESRVIQAYLVAGVNIGAFCKAGESNNANYFQPQFNGDREFSNRPYYYDTLREHPSGTTSEQGKLFFHKTPPYIDTTANGFVQSFCRDVSIPPSVESNAIFCFDVAQAESAAEDIVRAKMDSFGGDVLLATCSPKGLVAGGSLIFSIMLLFGWLYQYALRSEEQSKTLGLLQGLMRNFPVPYCHCDEKDHIKHLNTSFARLMGFPTVPTALARLRDKPFVELLADEDSCRAYDRALQSRRNRRKEAFNRPYHAKVLQVGLDRPVDVTVSARWCQTPSLRSRGMPRRLDCS